MPLREASVSRDQLNYQNPEVPSLPAEYTTIASFVAKGFNRVGIPVALGGELDDREELPILISRDFREDFLSAVIDTDFESDRVTHPGNPNRPKNLEEHLIRFAEHFAEGALAKHRPTSRI